MSYLSVGIALITFFGILLYHVYLQIHGATFWKRFQKPNFQLCWVSDNSVYNLILNETDTEANLHSANDHALVSTTYIEFPAAVLEDAPSK